LKKFFIAPNSLKSVIPRKRQPAYYRNYVILPNVIYIEPGMFIYQVH